ncbi:site-specific DNA-methyltransferase [Paenibacillus xylanexedens]|uniref:DNA-methyltransferase n=1 Tax=Paenibacillus xylanexedens TaxID=528191 RepID=UPI0011A39E70|nr:site-specific DNA-methyltransferase [Paenibacillus xylanexedens]
MIELNRIYNENCLEGMRRIPDKSVDMILCDLPYGTTACRWDTIIPFEPLWEQYKRIIKDNGAIVLTASQPFTSALVMSNPKMFKCEWIWEKNRGSNFGSVKYVPMKEHESVLVFGNGRVTYNPIMQERKGSGSERVRYKIVARTKTEVYADSLHGEVELKTTELRYPSSIQKFNTEVGLHPTQKPVDLFRYLIRTYTNPGETVLDNCMGSGTTAVAATLEGRNFIGFETDAGYVGIANERLATIVRGSAA